MRLIKPLLILVSLMGLCAIILASGALSLGTTLPYDEIAFLTDINRREYTQIFRMDLSRNIEIAVGRIHAASEINYSPDGRYLMIHAGTRFGEFDDLYVMDTQNGNRLRNLTDSPLWEYYPVWSPDSQHIAYAPQVKSGGSLYLVSAETRTRQPLIDESLYIADRPAWSPAGDVLVFPGQERIVSIDTDGQTRTLLEAPDAYINSLAWSLDQRTLAFTSNQSGDWEIYLLDITADSPAQQMTALQSPFRIESLSWSPDGEQLAFVAYVDNNQEIHTLNTADGTLTRLTFDTSIQALYHVDGLPSWSTDGQRILFASNREGDYHIYSMQRDGRDVQRITDYSTWRYALRPVR